MGSDVKAVIKEGFKEFPKEGVSEFREVRRKGVLPTKEFDIETFVARYCQKMENAQIFILPEQEVQENKPLINACLSDLSKLEGSGPHRIANVTQYPYSAVGMVLSKLNGSVKFGTGCLIGPNMVLTCGHNIFDARTKAMHTQIQFIPSLISSHHSIRMGFKSTRFFLSEQYRKGDPNKSAKYNQCFLSDYAVLLLDTEYNLEEYFGSFGYDFDWQESEEHLEAIRKEGVFEEMEIIGFKAVHQWRTELELNSYRGSVFVDRDFLLYVMNTSYGVSGAPVFSKAEGEYVVRGIHQRDISQLLEGDQLIAKKAGLKLKMKIYQDIKKHLRGDAHHYSLGKKDIVPEFMPKMIEAIRATEIKKQGNGQASLSIDLTGNSLRDQGCELIANSRLDIMSLNLCTNKIGWKGCQWLAGADWKKLNYLCLRNNLITFKGVTSLSKAEWRYLQTLDLWDCHIGDEGCEALARAQWPYLKILNLRTNDITFKGCMKLAKAAWNYLQQLNLRNNEIKDKGCEELSKAQWKHLAILNLRYTGIEEKGCKWLSQGQWGHLQSLDIRDNEIGKEGCLSFKHLKWLVEFDRQD